MNIARLGVLAIIAGVAVTGCGPKQAGEGKCPHMAKNNSEAPVERAPEEPDTSACDGRQVEMITYRWPNDKIQKEQQIVRGEDGSVIPHGVVTTYWEDGGKKVETHYVCGVKHGAKRAWHLDGSDWQKAAYFNGKDHGIWTEWLKDGTLLRQFTMRYGAWHGVYTDYHTNGQKRTEVEWIDGKKQGIQTYWDKEGNVYKKFEYVDGVEQPGAAP